MSNTIRVPPPAHESAPVTNAGGGGGGGGGGNGDGGGGLVAINETPSSEPLSIQAPARPSRALLAQLVHAAPSPLGDVPRGLPPPPEVINTYHALT